jgi:hypothetical protein
MRQIWVVSDDKSVAEQLTAILTVDVYGVRYVVSQTDSLTKVPPRDLADPGVIFLLDAFHSQTAGFTGARELRRRGFTGHVFICGEPAPEEAVSPFTSGEISGFLPPVHRLDYSFAGGLIHAATSFSRELRLSTFLGRGGRASTETIQSISDFNQLTMKLINFVSRFGVDVQKIKKVLVSVAYSHVQSSPSGVVIPKPFKFSFGLDPKKIIIATSVDLDPEKEESLKSDFCASLQEHRTSTVPGGRTVRADFRNTAKLTENLSIVWGEAQGVDAWKKASNAYIIVSMPFNFQTEKGERPYYFNFVRVKSTQEIEEPVADTAPTMPSFESGPSPETRPAQPVSDKKPHEPEILGDTPKALEPEISEVNLRSKVSKGVEKSTSKAEITPTEAAYAAAEAAEAAAASPINSDEYQALKDKYDATVKELQEQKTLAKSLAEDVKRLMKERRQPISSGELKELGEELKGKVERLQAQNKALTDEVLVKEGKIKDLDEQVKRLKVAA